MNTAGIWPSQLQNTRGMKTGVADSNLVPFQALFGWDSCGSRILEPALASQAGNGLPGNIHQFFFQFPSPNFQAGILRPPNLRAPETENKLG